MLSAGAPAPLGATVMPEGINFAIVAPRAAKVELCVFNSSGTQEQQRLELPGHTDGVRHGHLAGARPGLVYGYRVHGPWAPHEGHRFNPSKLLLDPYAREVVGRYAGEDLFLGHEPGRPERRDARDNAAIALKARVVAPQKVLGANGVRLAPEDRVLCELHVKGHTQQHPEVPPDLRGSYAGLAEPVVLDRLKELGITTLSLMPVQHRADEPRLLAMGLRNYWGYNPIAWFAPESRYWSGRPGSTPASEFRALADAVHARGMELVIDVVFNHSAESDEFGPTLSLRGIDNTLYYHLHPEDRSRYQNWAGTGNCLNLAEPRVLRMVMDSLRCWVGELGVDGFRFDLAPVLARREGGRFDPHAPFLAAVAQDPVLSRALMIAEPWDIGPGGYRLGEFPPGWLEWNDRFRDTQRRFWLHGGTGVAEFARRFTASSDVFDRNGRAPTASVNFVTAHDGFTLRDLLSYNHRHNLANGEHNHDGHSHNLSRNCGVEGDTDDPAVLAERRRLQRVLLAALLLSQGTPMLLAGDEFGQSQQGNNNAYCQDNETTWLDWQSADRALSSFVARLLALRREAEALRSARWWPDAPADTSGTGATTLRWLAPEGRPMSTADWEHDGRHALAILFDAPAPASRWLVLLNAAPREMEFSLPPGHWRRRLATDAEEDDNTEIPMEGVQRLRPGSLWVAQQRAGSGAGPDLQEQTVGGT